jgi:hypothetical protein
MAGSTISFSEWAPDLSDLGTNVSNLISGCIPQADGFGPFKSLAEFTQALPDNARGYFFARKSDGSIAVFAGTSTRLYKLNNTTFAWDDTSKGGMAYSTLVASDNWRFEQFADFVIAVQSNTVPQKFVLSSATLFVDLAGSPPNASHIAIINRFVVLTGLLSEPRRVQWSDLDGPETWTAGVGLSDFQDLPDGGTVHGISGGDAYGVIFQDEPIRMLTYSPGSAVTFTINRISQNDPLFAQYSPVVNGDKTAFISAQGFKIIEPGSAPRPIGKERVDRFFFGDVDRGNLQLVIGAADPTATRFYWAYKSQSGQAGLFDKVLSYDWSIGENGRWTILPLSGEYLSALARPGLTLEQLDAIAPGQLHVLGTAAGPGGVVRLELDAISNANFSLGTVGVPSQNFCEVQNIVGTIEGNGSWVYTIPDATHIDLVGSVWANAWISGGAIGGSLDALPFSLDSISVAAISALSAVSSNHKVGFFTGPNIEAILETPEQDLEGQLVFIDSSRPITDCADGMVSIAGRIRAQDVSTYTTESAIDTRSGQAYNLIETRYAKGRLRNPAGSTWSFARGIQPNAQPAGDT